MIMSGLSGVVAMEVTQLPWAFRVPRRVKRLSDIVMDAQGIAMEGDNAMSERL
jgi:hypothetical protein